jgi:hypothetical protein
VEIPLQRAVERHACPDESLATVDQQPQVELRPGQRRHRQRVDSRGQRGPGDGDRLDLVAPATRGSSGACRPSAGSKADRANAVAARPRDVATPIKHEPSGLQTPTPDSVTAVSRERERPPPRAPADAPFGSARELARLSHDHWLTAVMFSPDGTRLATASQDNSARV